MPWLVLLLAELDDEVPELDDVDEVAAGLGVELPAPPVLDESELDAVMTRGAEAVGSGAE